MKEVEQKEKNQKFGDQKEEEKPVPELKLNLNR